ncbi:unnamed protein product [Caenorhabditis auriculariae]|uniref:Uncharacterized protein n=1 Tax=Caenorhabditis auriculariae TaxID=2777116 RepID=A0A8S1HGI7_9PELO|nr:unnamed protein product [Caenorhabditis auriculariae]
MKTASRVGALRGASRSGRGGLGQGRPDLRTALLESTRRPCSSPTITAVPVQAKLRDLLVEERGEGP